MGCCILNVGFKLTLLLKAEAQQQIQVIAGCTPPSCGRSTKSAIFSWRNRALPAVDEKLGESSAFLHPSVV